MGRCALHITPTDEEKQNATDRAFMEAMGDTTPPTAKASTPTTTRKQKWRKFDLATNRPDSGATIATIAVAGLRNNTRW